MRDTGTQALPGVTLDARARLLPIEPISRLRTGDGEAERRGQTQNDGGQSQISKWARRFIHPPIISAKMNL